MKRQLFSLLIGALLIPANVICAQQMTPESYIKNFAPVAVSEMERSGIPASITLAQGLLESSNGNSDLATIANNHFGIKCHKEWNGDTYFKDDDAKNECFRYYKSPVQSYIDHTDFLKTRDRYAFLFQLDKYDYSAWARGLKQAGYATNPQYPELLINLIERYNLSQYDKMDAAQLVDKQGEKIQQVKKTEIEAKTDLKPLQNDESANQEAPIVPYIGEIFLLNNIKAIKADEDGSPMKVAMKYNIPVKYIYKYNDLHEGESFLPGQFIFLQPKRNKGYAKTHKVKSGESMYQIAQAYGIKLSELYLKNKLEEGVEVSAGEVLNLRDDRDSAPKSMTYETWLKEKNKPAYVNKTPELKEENTVPANRVVSAEKVKAEGTPLQADILIEKPEETRIVRYEVKPGDTLYNISKRFNTPIEKIIQWNSLPDNQIRLGQNLVVAQ